MLLCTFLQTLRHPPLSWSVHYNIGSLTFLGTLGPRCWVWIHLNLGRLNINTSKRQTLTNTSSHSEVVATWTCVYVRMPTGPCRQISVYHFISCHCHAMFVSLIETMHKLALVFGYSPRFLAREERKGREMSLIVCKLSNKCSRSSASLFAKHLWLLCMSLKSLLTDWSSDCS